MARLPLFPLGTVLFPGLPLPLHVFEERYRRLVRTLLDRPADERRFGVIGIRAGLEVGTAHHNELYDIGCVAELRRAVPHPDGRFDVLAVGTGRFRLLGTHDDGGLAIGEVEWLDEPVDAGDAELTRSVHEQFSLYVQALRDARGLEPGDLPELPPGPLATSWAVAGAAVLPMAEKQELLAAASVADRLRQEIDLLRRETALARGLHSRPAVELTRPPFSAN